MGDLGLIGLVVLGLWFWEGWVRVPRGAWVFRCRRKHWSADGTRNLPENGSWAWLWLPLCVGHSRILLAQGSPVSPATEGVWLHSSQAPNPGPRIDGEGALVDWNEVAALKSEPHRLVHKGIPQGAVQNPALLDRIRRELVELASVQEAKRGAALEAWVARTLDPTPVRRHLRRLDRLTGELGLGLGIYAFWLLVFMPLMVFLLGWSTIWPSLLIITLVQQVFLACLARHAHILLLPGHSEERLSWVISCFLSPAALLRSCEQLAAKVTADAHPIALALALMEREEKTGRDLLVRLARDLYYPCEPIAEHPSEHLLRVDLEHRERLLANLERQLGIQGQTPSGEVSPQRISHTGEAWCPRCREVYMRDGGVCTDCGVALMLKP